MKRKVDSKWLALIAITLAVLAFAVFISLFNNKKQAIDYSDILIDNGDSKINWDKYDTYDVELKETYTIGKSGTYHLTGSINDGLVIVNAGNGVVRLILDNVTIKNTSGPAIACYNADDLVIQLVGENLIEDATSYSSDYDEDVKGAIYSKADLTLTGDGSLILIANNEDGIVSKDDLKINGGKYIINAKDDGIRGKDSVYIVDGDINIVSLADGIKSNNETVFNKGFILIENGNIKINAGAKGLKAISHIVIQGGDVIVESKDDSMHSDRDVNIVGGSIEINSGDDGIHANNTLRISGGGIEIKKSYEGIEAQVISINDGKVSVVASDDGINAGGGADGSANVNGAGALNADPNCNLVINGGTVYINASGDGLDSNGYLTFNGGTVIVDGPTNNGNGALDSGAGISINGGTVVAVGASGMAENLGQKSSINNVSIFFTSVQKAGTKIVIKDSSGKTIISHESTKVFNHIAAGSSDFIKGEKYTIYINGTEYQSFTINSVVTTIGSSETNQNRPGQMPMMRR